MTYSHQPVLMQAVLGALSPHDNGIYIDATFGRGGYTRAILSAAKTRVYACDRDPDAIAAGESLVREFSPRLILKQGPFGALDIIFADVLSSKVDGIAFDLGLSSPQIDDAARGFSFQKDGPLDMRMAKNGPSAADVVNSLDEKSLADIIFTLGEERYSRRIAKKICEVRQETFIQRTADLARIIRSQVPRSKDGIDPATRTFQALRLYVNDELNELRRALTASEILLNPKGRLAVVSFHSLEDKIVKNFMRSRASSSIGFSRHAPANDATTPSPSFQLITKKALTPTNEEIRSNPRSRSAKMRVAERTEAPFHTKEEYS